MALTDPLITPVSLTLPGLPTGLEGMRIVHLTDVHVHRRRSRHRRIAEALQPLEFDLAVFTGDYITFSTHETTSLEVMSDICRAIRAKHGIFGVFGNHDTPQLRQRFGELPVRWLHDAGVQLTDVPLEIMGFKMDRWSFPDPVATLAAISTNGTDNTQEHDETQPRPLRILLSHLPTYISTASDLGIDLMLSGHTHGGQCRLPWRRAILNSTDLPWRLTSGVLRHRDTLCAVSRGLGEVWLPMRLFCPPHIPVYTLSRGPLPGEPTEHIENIMPW